MFSVPVRRRHLVAGGLASLPFLAGCAADSPLTAPAPTAAPSASVQAFSLGAADFVVAGVAVGSFGAYVADTSKRATTEFWDNPSADQVVGTEGRCNIGHWASGNFGAACTNDATGSDANIPAANTWTRYWGDGPGGRDPSAFMFKGSYPYRVKLLASYAGNQSVVGWFTKANGVYTFNPVAPFGDRLVNSEIVVPAGADWGLYISNGFNAADNGCGDGSVKRYCSDAEGGFTAVPFQQHSLFTTQTGLRFLVGMEDNKLEVGPDGSFRDSDYQDYVFSVEPIVPLDPDGGPVGGCSPGFWRNQRGDAWPGGYAPTTLFTSVFGEGANPEAFAGRTLLDVLTSGGGGLTALGRHTVAALLNAATANNVMNYELTPQQVIDKFKAVYPGGNYGALADEFEALQDEGGRVCTVPRVNANAGRRR